MILVCAHTLEYATHLVPCIEILLEWSIAGDYGTNKDTRGQLSRFFERGGENHKQIRWKKKQNTIQFQVVNSGSNTVAQVVTLWLMWLWKQFNNSHIPALQIHTRCFGRRTPCTGNNKDMNAIPWASVFKSIGPQVCQATVFLMRFEWVLKKG